MRHPILALAALLLLAPPALAEGAGEMTKESLYRDLEAEGKLYDKTVNGLHDELVAIVKAIKEVLEPAGGPEALNVAPRTPEQQKALDEAQAKAQGLVDRMLEEELRHRRHVLELIEGGRDLIRAELAGLISQGKVPNGTLRDLLMPPGQQKVEVPKDDDEDAKKKKSLFDEKDEDDESIE